MLHNKRGDSIHDIVRLPIDVSDVDEDTSLQQPPSITEKWVHGHESWLLVDPADSNGGIALNDQMLDSQSQSCIHNASLGSSQLSSQNSGIEEMCAAAATSRMTKPVPVLPPLTLPVKLTLNKLRDGAPR